MQPINYSVVVWYRAIIRELKRTGAKDDDMDIVAMEYLLKATLTPTVWDKNGRSYTHYGDAAPEVVETTTELDVVTLQPTQGDLFAPLPQGQ
jgi:hypothetical protein